MGERIKLLRGSKRQTEFAQEIGIAQNTLGGYERGTISPKVDVLRRIEKVTGAPVEWIITGRGIVRDNDEQAALPNDPTQEQWKDQLTQLGNDVTLVPRLNVKLSAGGGALLNDENIAELVPFPTRLLKRLLPHTPAKQLAFAQVDGDSMEPTIQEGNDVLLDLGVTDFVDNAIYALRYGDVIVIKRLQRLNNGVKIMADNPTYQAEIIPASDADQLQIIGRVKWSMQNL